MTPRAPHLGRTLTAGETVVAWVVGVVICAPLLLGAIWIVSTAVDAQAQRN